MTQKQIDALQQQINTLFGGRGEIQLRKTSDFGGQFIVVNGDQELALGDSFEAAYDRLLELSGVNRKLRRVWPERRGRPRKE